jgi:hypothetical protein
MGPVAVNVTNRVRKLPKSYMATKMVAFVQILAQD